jgi:hypothetical protein
MRRGTLTPQTADRRLRLGQLSDTFPAPSSALVGSGKASAHWPQRGSKVCFCNGLSRTAQKNASNSRGKAIAWRGMSNSFETVRAFCIGGSGMKRLLVCGLLSVACLVSLPAKASADSIQFNLDCTLISTTSAHRVGFSERSR